MFSCANSNGGRNSDGGILNSLMVTNACAAAAVSPLRSGHPGVQEEAEASEDPHAGRHREDRHGRRLQDCQRHAHDDLRANRSAESAPSVLPHLHERPRSPRFETVSRLLLVSGITNYDEYSLVRDILEEKKEETMGTLKRDKTLLRDDKKMEKLKQKLHTDDECTAARLPSH